MRPMILDRQIIDNHWQHLDDTTPLPADAAITLNLSRWLQERSVVEQRSCDTGLRLPNDCNVEEIELDLSTIPLIVIDFPIIDTNKRGYHPDGKAYSQARLLRERCGYAGELRARGAGVIGDVLAYMERCGVNAFELREGEDYGEALARFTDFELAYQGAAAGPEPVFLRRRATT